MAVFRILDALNTPFLTVETKTTAGLGKYLPDGLVDLLAVRPMAAALAKPFAEAPADPVAFEFTFSNALSLGAAAGLAIDAGARAAIGVHHAGTTLFPAHDLAAAVDVPGGTAFVSFAFCPRVEVALDGTRGPLALGFDAGASMNARYGHPFDVAGRDLSLGDALADTLRSATLPGDVSDLRDLQAGAYASVEGLGELRLSASVQLASALNPLATPGLPILGAAKLAAGASATVDADFRANGTFELRVTRTSDRTVQLSYYRTAGTAVAIDAKASLGVGAALGDSDIIRTLLAAVSPDPQADLVALVNAGLSDAQIEALQSAVTASVDRTLRAAAELQFTSVRRGGSLFTFELEPDTLDAAGRDAVEQALRGRITPIQRLAATGAPGIRALHTGVLGERARRITWRINLFGILNVMSVSELLRTGTLSYDPLTGTLNAADEISSRRILVKTRPFEADGEQVRKLVFESLIVSAAYHASRVTSGVALACSGAYFESRARTDARDIRADFNAIMALGLADAAARDRLIGAEHDFGASTFLVECTFDRAASDALFLASTGPRTPQDYERIGREAMLALIPAGDADRAHRRAAIADDGTWRALVAGGPAHMRHVLAARLGAIRAEHVIGDYVLIRWWADAMAKAARALAEMRQFLGGRSAVQLMEDAQFLKRRARLEDALADAVKESRARLGDPWGLLALDLAANRAARAQATIVSPRLTAVFDTRVAVPAQTVRLIAPAAARDALGDAAADAAPRPFTVEEREALRRHAINLRRGALSSDGEFQTGEADVRRLFTELLPAEIEARRAEGLPARLLVYAHGGLVEERRGLEPVLTRLKFWRRNHVYPLSFVWETGLKETVADILRNLRGARDVAARGVGEDLLDAFLETAARQPGKTVWNEMKRAAETSVLDGGGALLVAQHIRDLWNVHHQHLEIHAVGHSAGAIFLAHFVPALLAQKVAAGAPGLHVKTVHLLAPAATTSLFKARLKDLVGPARGVKSLTVYTMNKSLEQDDTAGPYKKSLLYLVSRSFETDVPTPVLGLEESLRQDLQLIRFFGLAGNTRAADLLFSRTPSTAARRDRTEAARHGGFDEDRATMNSVMRRVLDVPDEVAIADFFQESLEPEHERTLPEPGTIPFVVASEPAADTHGGGEWLDWTTSAPIGATTGPVASPSEGARRALCVGIDAYPATYELAGCVNDARDWKAALEHRGFEVMLLQDRAATREAMLDALRSLVRGAEPGDVVVFQYSGHGTQVDDLDGEEPDALDEAFCPWDFTEGRLIVDDDVRAIVAGMKDGVNFTCFIDCCHSGTITRALRGGARWRRLPPGTKARYVPYSEELSARHRQFRARAADEERVVPLGTARGDGTPSRQICFSACQPHEVAYEEGGSGQFTKRSMAVLAGSEPLTTVEFWRRVVAAFGTQPPQRPHLDCPEAARAHPLLGPFVQPAALAVG